MPMVKSLVPTLSDNVIGPVSWTPDGGLINIGAAVSGCLSGGLDTYAVAVNASGLVVGNSYEMVSTE